MRRVVVGDVDVDGVSSGHCVVIITWSFRVPSPGEEGSRSRCVVVGSKIEVKTT